MSTGAALAHTRNSVGTICLMVEWTRFYRRTVGFSRIMPAIRKLSYDYTFPFYFQAQLPHVKVHAYFAPVTPPTAVGGSGQRLCRCCVILWQQLPSPGLHEVSLPPEDPSLSDVLHHHPNLLILHWERHLQVKDFCRDCSNSCDSFYLYSAVMQSVRSLVSITTGQEWS